MKLAKTKKQITVKAHKTESSLKQFSEITWKHQNNVLLLKKLSNYLNENLASTSQLFLKAFSVILKNSSKNSLIRLSAEIKPFFCFWITNRCSFKISGKKVVVL